MLSCGIHTLDKIVYFYPYSRYYAPLLNQEQRVSSGWYKPQFTLISPHPQIYQGFYNTVDGLRSLNSQVSVPSWSGLAEVAFTRGVSALLTFRFFQSNPSFI